MLLRDFLLIFLTSQSTQKEEKEGATSNQQSLPSNLVEPEGNAAPVIVALPLQPRGLDLNTLEIAHTNQAAVAQDVLQRTTLASAPCAKVSLAIEDTPQSAVTTTGQITFAEASYVEEAAPATLSDIDLLDEKPANMKKCYKCRRKRLWTCTHNGR